MVLFFNKKKSMVFSTELGPFRGGENTPDQKNNDLDKNPYYANYKLI